MPKPFNRDRLEQALNRINTKEKTTTNTIKFLAVKKRQKVQLIPMEDVLYIKGAGVYTELL